MKKKSVLPILFGVLTISITHLALASNVNIGVGVNLGGGRPVYAAPVYVAPAPVYVAPAPVYIAPAPVPAYIAVAPAYVAAPPVSHVSISIGWHGNNYWDGHRYWTRQEWQAHHPDPWRR